jgi:hypothetical protein
MRHPGVGDDNELHADQLQTGSYCLVYQRFRPRGIQFAIAHQSAVHVVIAHGPVIRAADAAKERLVTGSGGRVHVDELWWPPVLDVIVAATPQRLDADSGTIQPGKRANLLLLSANPGEDIRNLAPRGDGLVRDRPPFHLHRFSSLSSELCFGG